MNPSSTPKFINTFHHSSATAFQLPLLNALAPIVTVIRRRSDFIEKSRQVILLALILFAACSGYAQGIADAGASAPTPGANDQYSLTGDSDSGNYIDNQRPGQSFTVGANPLGYVLTGLYIREKSGTAGGGQPQATTYNIRIYSLTNATAGSATLLTQYVMTNQLTIVQGNWIRVTGLTNVLAANGIYAFSINRNGGAGWWTPAADNTQPYAAGRSGNFPTGSGAVAFNNYDLAFDVNLVVNGDPLVFDTAISPANPVYAGTPVTLSAVVSGTAPINTFVWQGGDGVTWTNLPGSTTNTYALNTTGMTATTNQYRLIVTGAAGTTTNNPGSLILLNASSPILTANTVLSPATVAVGKSSVMTAAFVGTLPIYYQWQYTNNNGGSLVDIPGATNSTFTLTNAQFGNAGSYRLVASNSVGVTSSSFATLVVRPPVVHTSFGSTAPTPNDGDDLAQFGENAAVNPTGLNYYADNGNPPGQVFTTGSNPGGYSLAALYVRWFSDGVIAAGNPWTLRLYSLAATNSTTATLLAEYENDNVAPAIDDTWSKWYGNITNILNPNSVYAYTIRARNIAGTTGAGFLEMGSVDGNPFPGGHSVGIDEDGNPVQQTATGFDATFMLDLVPAGYPAVQDVSMNPTNGSAIFAGAPVTLSATAIGTSISYIWQTDNGTGGASFSDLPTSNTSSYALNTSAFTPNTYQLRVIVTNSFNAVTSSVLTLTVQAAVIQTVSIAPANSPANPVYVGTPVTLSATALGNNLTYFWQGNDGAGGSLTNIPNSNTNVFNFGTSAMPTVPGTYLYQLMVSNAAGTVTSSQLTLNLTNASAPVLLTGTTLTPQVIFVGGSSVMTATFTGSQPFTGYQWYFATNGVTNAIAGATTNSFTLTNAQLANAGTYFITVSNNPPGIGPTASSSTPATLFVAQPPVTNTVSAGVFNSGSSDPLVGAYDIAQLSADGSGVQPAGLNYYVDNRPGQIFTTGSTPPSPAGYPLLRLYVKHDSAGTVSGDFGTPTTYTLRIYSVLDGTNVALLTSYLSTNSMAFPAGNWIRWEGMTNVFKTNSTYAFSIARTSGYWKMQTYSGNAYPDGDAVTLPVTGGAATFSTAPGFYDATFVLGMTAAAAPVEDVAMTIVPSSINTGQGPVVMTASFSGTSPITYQWQHEGTNIPSATATTYTIPVATVPAAGTYVCYASNVYSLGSPTPSTAQVLTVDPTVQTNLINATTRNGSFELVSGAPGGAAKVNFNTGTVNNWTTWPAFPNSGDTGADASAAATEGTRDAFLQGDSGIYNLAGHIITAGDVFTYTWDWVLAGRGPAVVQLGYWNGSSVVLIPGTDSSAPGGGGVLLALGTNYTVMPGNPAIGKPVVLTVHAPNGSNYPEVDNVVLTVVPGTGGPIIATNPTNLTSVVTGGTNLALSWPSDHLGWFLQTQTNSRSVGLTTPTNTWFDVPGSDTITNTSIGIDKTNGTVFFRLRSP